MPTLTEVGTTRLPAPWRAACVILCEQFRDDTEVWSLVRPGESIDLSPVIYQPRRPLAERIMAAAAQSLVDGDTMVPFGRMASGVLTDRQLRSLLDALAIARGSLPID